METSASLTAPGFVIGAGILPQTCEGCFIPPPPDIIEKVTVDIYQGAFPIDIRIIHLSAKRRSTDLIQGIPPVYPRASVEGSHSFAGAPWGLPIHP